MLTEQGAHYGGALHDQPRHVLRERERERERGGGERERERGGEGGERESKRERVTIRAFTGTRIKALRKEGLGDFETQEGGATLCIPGRGRCEDFVPPQVRAGIDRSGRH